MHSTLFDENLKELTKTKWPILVAVGVGGQAVMLVLMSWGNEQGVLVFCRKEKEREAYFVDVLATQTKTIERRCSDTDGESIRSDRRGEEKVQQRR